MVDRSGITPNVITILGFLGICAASWLALERLWVISSLVFVASGLVDSLDGLVARHQGRATKFGAFLDSTLDRLAEGVVFGAIGITFAQDGMDWALAACFVALTGSFIVSYARARAEGLGIPGSSGGLMGRPERLVIVGAGLFLGAVGDVLPVLMVILAGLSLMTAVHRIVLVYDASDGRTPRRP
jgi:CDP-diacylglycerol--glycerol-3-phosphate 3-phosphatidyltransferase